MVWCFGDLIDVWGLMSCLLDYFKDVDVFSSDVENDVEEAFGNSLVQQHIFSLAEIGIVWSQLEVG